MGAIRIRQEKSAQIVPIRLNKNSGPKGNSEVPKMKKRMNAGIKEDIAPHKIVTKIHTIKVLAGREGVTIIFDRYL